MNSLLYQQIQQFIEQIAKRQFRHEFLVGDLIAENI
jgi:hypothetical protein